MHHKFSAKIAIWFTLIFILMFLILNTFGIHYLEKKIINERVEILYEEAQLISSEYLSNYYGNTSTLSNIRTQLATIDTFLNVRIWAINKTGQVIVDTRDENAILFPSILSAVPQLFEKNYLVNTTLNDLVSEPVLAICYSFSSDFDIQGYVVIMDTMQNITHSATKYIDVINISLILIALILIGTFIYLNRIIIQPIKELNNGVKEFANGNFNYQIKIKSTDEFGNFKTAINYMAHELSHLEEYQKKFIANISHDFRSPLTSIQGYAEAIKDGTIPYEIQNKYLDIILFESKRLTKLTSNLLTLNNIKQNGTLLDIVSFDMNHIIKTTATTFEGTCTKRKITLDLTFDATQSLVCGDVDKIQQVIYNLIDNAIKFSPNNSIIHITTEEKNDKLFISVKDHGIGIPPDSINKIWERFYKTDLSRGKDKKGTGLGLSIVKEIISAHNENITVASTTDVGTEFIFTLPMSDDSTK